MNLRQTINTIDFLIEFYRLTRARTLKRIVDAIFLIFIKNKSDKIEILTCV